MSREAITMASSRVKTIFSCAQNAEGKTQKKKRKIRQLIILISRITNNQTFDDWLLVIGYYLVIGNWLLIIFIMIPSNAGVSWLRSPGISRGLRRLDARTYP